MSDFDSEKKDGQARPDYYQPNQNAGGTYYNPPQNEQAQDSNTTYHYSYANNNQQAGSNYYKQRKMTIIHKTEIHQSRQRKIRPVK